MKKTLALVLAVIMVFACVCASAEEVVLKLGDREVTLEEMQSRIQTELRYRANVYAMYGYSYDVNSEANIADVRQSVITGMKQQIALLAKAEELGLDQLTDEETQIVNEQGQLDFDQAVAYVKNYMTGTEGMDDEAVTQAVVEQLEQLGITPESYAENEKNKMTESKMRAWAVQDVTVTDEEVLAEYDARVEKDRSAYEGNAGLWTDAALSGTFMYYTPAGVRRVKQILTRFRDEDKAAITEAQQQLSSISGSGTEEEIAAANQAVEDARETAFANLDEEVDAILAALDAEGADWQALMDEKNQDPGMQTYPQGYAVAEGMSRFDPAFLEAALALENPGDHSGKIRGNSYGYYIIRYDSDEPEGPVALEDVKQSIADELLSARQNETYKAAVEQWVLDAGFEEHLELLGE